MPRRFARLEVRAPTVALAERVAAEAWAAGAAGLEERGAGGHLLVYVAEEGAAAVRAALGALAPEGVRVGAPEPVAPVDWSHAWRAGLGEVVISPRLSVRPPFVAGTGGPGRGEVVIDPGQAFGTGGHASTRLALALLDTLPRAECAAGTALDVGCGSGVLALAALRLGAPAAVALDLDPVAARATRDNARRNGLAARLRVFAGPVAALGRGGFAPVLANLLRRELLPLLPELARRLRPGAALVLSGLLADERAEVEAALAGAGLGVADARAETDPGGDAWLALTARGRGDAEGR